MGCESVCHELKPGDRVSADFEVLDAHVYPGRCKLRPVGPPCYIEEVVCLPLTYVKRCPVEPRTFRQVKVGERFVRCGDPYIKTACDDAKVNTVQLEGGRNPGREYGFGPDVVIDN